MERSDACKSYRYTRNLSSTAENFSIFADVGMSSGGADNDLGIAFSVQNEDTFRAVVWVNPQGDYSDSSYERRIEIREGKTTQLYAQATPVYLDNAMHQMQVKVLSGKHVQVYLDGQLFMEYSFSESRPLYGVGLYSWDNDSGVYYDNVEVYLESEER